MSHSGCVGDGLPTRSKDAARSDFPGDRRRQISHQTIYTWIRAEEAAGKHRQRHLRRLGRKREDRENRGRLPASVSIEGRPSVVDRRSRFGDWEGDTIVGANRRGGAVTLVERKSGYLLLAKVPNLQAATVRQAAAQRYATTPKTLRKTLTLDNGKEFAEHKQLEVEAALRIYFAKPYRRGNAAPTKTPMAWCETSFPRARTWPTFRSIGSPKFNNFSMTVRENAWAIGLPMKFSPHA